MLLTAHILAVAAIAGRLDNIFLAFLAGIAVSIAIDLIPHHENPIRKLAPLVKNIDKKNLFILGIFIADVIVAILISVILIANAQHFVVTNIFGDASKRTVLVAIIGSLLVPLYEAPYKLFGLDILGSKKLFELKSRLMFFDKGLSGYLVQIALIILSIILITQLVQTPFGLL